MFPLVRSAAFFFHTLFSAQDWVLNFFVACLYEKGVSTMKQLSLNFSHHGSQFHMLRKRNLF